MNNIINNIVSIVALLLSLFNLLYILCCNHKKVNLKLNAYTMNIVNGKYIYIFDLLIENRSRLPIAVNSINLINNKDVYMFSKNPKLISEVTTMTDKYNLFTASFPININGLVSERKFLELISNYEISDKCLFKMLTNRGTASKIIDLNSYFLKSNRFINEYKDLIKYQK